MGLHITEYAIGFSTRIKSGLYGLFLTKENAKHLMKLGKLNLSLLFELQKIKFLYSSTFLLHFVFEDIK